MGSNVVHGERAGTPRPVDSINDGTNERLAVDARLTSGFVAEVNLDRTTDEVTAYGPACTMSSPTSVSCTTTAAQIFAANTNRVGYIVNHHSGTADVFVGPATVTATSYTYRVQPGEVLIATYGYSTGALQAITSSGTATIICTDLTGPNP